MAKKADEIRKALIDGASPHKLAHVAVARAQRLHPDAWLHAAISQLVAILNCSPVVARMWVSEHCAVSTKI